MSTQTLTYQVNDMHCPSCPRLIQMDLEEKPGVIAVNADLNTKYVVIEFDPENISPEELSQTIIDSGYTPQKIS